MQRPHAREGTGGTMEQPVISQDSAVVEAPAADVPAELIEADPDQALVDQIEAPEPEAEDDTEEEYEGVKMRGKKADIERAKAERLMQADYTRKTQMVAAERQQLQQQAQFQQQFLQEAAQWTAYGQRIAAIDKLDRRQLDADTDRQLQIERSELVQAQQQVAQSAHAKQAQTFQQQQATLAQLKEQAAAYLTKQIAGVTPERVSAIGKYIADSGVPREAIENVITHMPQWAVFAHKADLYDSLVAKATKKTPPAPQEAPVTRVAATRATASKDPATMTDAEFAQWRRAQIKRR